MQKRIDWLHENRWVCLALVSIYFLVVVLPHEIVGRFIMNVLFADLPRPQLNITVLIFSMVVLSMYLFYLIKKVFTGNQNRLKLIYLCITLGLIVIVYNTLFVMATEAAHFPQYALMAILLFPLSKNYRATLFWATFLGGVDEAYQYFYLNPHATGYFDFNDVITDLLGAALGLLLLWISGIKEITHSIPWYKKSTFLVGIGTLLLLGLSTLMGLVSIYSNGDMNKAPITLMNKVPDAFWSYDKVGDLYFHVVHPIEGILIIIVLFGVYAWMGKD
ncbi:MAG: VanZ family protein [Saprospiraceae bacterium]|nr:VanZ family protein [Saprospiraceae bacterium]